jgi:competence protein ComK
MQLNPNNDEIRKSYEVNSSTIAVLPLQKEKNIYSQVIETDKTFQVKMKPMQIIDRSCRYYGSSYAGRKAGTFEIIRVSHKPPIAIDHVNNIFMFPTLSSNRPQCGWFSLKHVNDCNPTEFDNTIVDLMNGRTLELPVSFTSFQNQVQRTAWLRTKFMDRLEMQAEKNPDFMQLSTEN